MATNDRNIQLQEQDEYAKVKQALVRGRDKPVSDKAIDRLTRRTKTKVRTVVQSFVFPVFHSFIQDMAGAKEKPITDEEVFQWKETRREFFERWGENRQYRELIAAQQDRKKRNAQFLQRPEVVAILHELGERKALLLADQYVFGDNFEMFKTIASYNTYDTSAYRALVDAKNVYGDKLEWFRVFADVLHSKGAEACKALTEAKIVYGDTYDRFLEFADVTKSKGARACKALVDAQDIYGGKNDWFLEFARAAKQGGKSACDALKGAKDIYRQDMARLQEVQAVVLNSQKRNGSLFCLALTRLHDLYGDSFDKLNQVVSILQKYAKKVNLGIYGDIIYTDRVSRQCGTGEIEFEGLSKIMELCNNNVELFRLCIQAVSVHAVKADTLAYVQKEVISANKNEYGEWFKVFLDVLIQQGSDAYYALIAAKKKMYGENIEQCIETKNMITEIAQGPLGSMACRTVNRLVEMPQMPQGVRIQNRIFWEIGIKNGGLDHILYSYNLLLHYCEDPFSEEEQRQHWRQGMMQSPSNTLVSIGNMSEAFQTRMLRDKGFWEAGVRGNIIGVLKHYSFLLQHVGNTFSEEEQREHWRQGMMQDQTNTFRALWNMSEAFQTRMLRDKGFWEAGVRGNIVGVLKLYSFLLQHGDTFSEEEQREHWRQGMMQDPASTWLAMVEMNEPLRSKNLSNKAFWEAGMRKEPLALLTHYHLIPPNLFTSEEEQQHWLAGMGTNAKATIQALDELFKRNPQAYPCIQFHEFRKILLHPNCDAICGVLTVYGNSIDTCKIVIEYAELTTAYDKKTLEEFIAVHQSQGSEQAKNYLDSLKEKSKTMIRSEPPLELRGEEGYGWMVRHVFAEGYYSNYEKNLACGDQQGHLAEYTFDKTGYPISVSGVIGYSLKENQQENRDLLESYQQRLLAIRAQVKERGTREESLQKDFDAQVTALFDQYARQEFKALKSEAGVNSVSTKVALLTTPEKILALMLTLLVPDSHIDRQMLRRKIGDLALFYHFARTRAFEPYVQFSADAGVKYGDEVSKNYHLWNELANLYGEEGLKHTMRHEIFESQELRQKEKLETIFSQILQQSGKKLFTLTDPQLTGLRQVLDNTQIPPEKRMSVFCGKVMDSFIKNIKWPDADVSLPAEEQKNRLELQKKSYRQTVETELAAWGKDGTWPTFQEQVLPRLVTLRRDVENNVEAQIGDMLNTDFQMIQQEMSKYEPKLATTEKAVAHGRTMKMVAGKQKERAVRCFITKTQEAANARMGAGICIAGDPEMWENPNYFELLLLDEESGKCLGTVMLLSIPVTEGSIKGKKYLWMGPNPTESFTDVVNRVELYEKLKKTVVTFAEQNRFDGVIVPSDDSIAGACTNRMHADWLTAIKSSRLKDEKGNMRIVDFGGSHKLSGSYSYSNGALVWERTGA